MTAFHTLPHDQQVAHLHDLARHALQHWDGEFAEIELVKFRENAVFSARRGDGQRVALRIHRNGYHCAAALRSELLWMDALAGAGKFHRRRLACSPLQRQSQIGAVHCFLLLIKYQPVKCRQVRCLNIGFRQCTEQLLVLPCFGLLFQRS